MEEKPLHHLAPLDIQWETTEQPSWFDLLEPSELAFCRSFSKHATPLSEEEEELVRNSISLRAHKRFKEHYGVSLREKKEAYLTELGYDVQAEHLAVGTTGRQAIHTDSFSEHVELFDLVAEWSNYRAQEKLDLDFEAETYNSLELERYYLSYLEFYEQEASKFAKERRVVLFIYSSPFNPPGFYRLADDTPEDVLRHLGLTGDIQPPITFITGPSMRQIIAHLLSKDLVTEGIFNARHNNTQRTFKAISRVDLPLGVEVVQDSEKLLSTLNEGILARKQNGAALLKVHMDLMNCAYQAGGAVPVFAYDLTEALERLGHTRLSHGGFHTNTLRELYGRIVTLTSQWIYVLENDSTKRGKPFEETPYWIFQARRGVESEDGLDTIRVLLAGKRVSVPIYTTLLMQPGLWWTIADAKNKHIPIPSQILQLPIDGNGHQVERMTLQLTATLAILVRNSHEQHAGTEISYKTGTLLESSGIKTEEDFFQDSPNASKRLRNYLAGENFDAGAIGLLRKHKAFDIDIRDEADFCGSGYGWKKRFWESRLKVKIPKLFDSKSPS